MIANGSSLRGLSEVTTEKSTEPKRVYAAVRTNGGRSYMPIVEIVKDDGLREDMLADAVSMLRGARSRYAEFQELEGVWKEVDKL